MTNSNIGFVYIFDIEEVMDVFGKNQCSQNNIDGVIEYIVMLAIGNSVLIFSALLLFWK